MAALCPARVSVAENKKFKLHTLSAMMMGLFTGSLAYAETQTTSNQEQEMPVLVVVGEKHNAAFMRRARVSKCLIKTRLREHPAQQRLMISYN